MKHVLIALLSVSLVAGCGGYHKAKRHNSGAAAMRAKPTLVSVAAPKPTVKLSSGPISKACMASDRKARSRFLCGCIQTVANDTLSRADQSRAVKFYNNPQLAQDTRQSDNSSHEKFWQRYKAYGEQARRTCG